MKLLSLLLVLAFVGCHDGHNHHSVAHAESPPPVVEPPNCCDDIQALTDELDKLRGIVYQLESTVETCCRNHHRKEPK